MHSIVTHWPILKSSVYSERVAVGLHQTDLGTAAVTYEIDWSQNSETAKQRAQVSGRASDRSQDYFRAGYWKSF